MRPEISPTPHTTLVILLGASAWPRWPDLEASVAFANSAQSVKHYFLDPQKFHLPQENLLDLFDSDLSADDIDDAINQFLNTRITQMKAIDQAARDVCVYFIGHAGFVGDSLDYYLAIRRTQKRNPETSGLRIVSLARTVKEHTRYIRRILILDCCYAASAFAAFHTQGGGLQEAAIVQTVHAFRGLRTRSDLQRSTWPKYGTALLCSSSRSKPSLLSKQYTEFSHALMHVLNTGLADIPHEMSLHMVADLVQDYLDATCSDAPRPEVHSPDQSEGDVADIPFFPNPLYEEAKHARLTIEEQRSQSVEIEQAPDFNKWVSNPKLASSSPSEKNAAIISRSPNLAEETNEVQQKRNFSAIVPFIGVMAAKPLFLLSDRGQKRKIRVLMVIACSVLTILIVTVLIFSASKIINSGSGLTHPPASGSRIPAGIIHEFSIPTKGSHTTSIIQGSDGNLWFTEKNGNKIGRITPQGQITEFLIPTPNSITTEITRGSDGNLWFFENGGNKIGRITPQGRITEFQASTGSNLVGITSGPDGNLWFTEFDHNKIGRMTTSGLIIGEFAIPTANSGTETISAGPDGNVWFVEDWSDKIGRITPKGVITEFAIPTPLVPGQQNYHDLTVGSDGNLWFTEGLARKIGRITPQGDITEFPVPSPADYIGSLCSGLDGNLWFIDNANHIVRMTTTGKFTNFFVVPTANSDLSAITAGQDKKIWFTEYGGNKIGQITTGI